MNPLRKWPSYMGLVDAMSRTALGADTLLLYGIARHIDAKRILEIGVRQGGSTAALLLAAIENDGILTSLDKLRRCGNAIPNSAHWRFLCANSTNPDTLDQIGWETFDMLFLDSSHLAPQTRKELAIYLPHIRKGGVAVFHDTKGCSEGVTQPLMEWYTAHPGWNWKSYWKHPHGLDVLRRVD